MNFILAAYIITATTLTVVSVAIILMTRSRAKKLDVLKSTLKPPTLGEEKVDE